MTHLNTPNDAPTPQPEPDLQTLLDPGREQRLEGDRQMIQALIKHLETHWDTPTDLLDIAPQCSLHCWLQLYFQALDRPRLLAWAERQAVPLADMTLRNGELFAKDALTPGVSLDDASGWRRLAPPIVNIAQVIDPDAIGLPCPALKDANLALQLSARQILRFYGYPHPQQRVQRGAVIEDMQRLQSFCERAAPCLLATAFEQSNQDLHDLAKYLLGQLSAADLAKTAFSPRTLQQARWAFTSHSFCANALNTAASLLKGITEHPRFAALEQTLELQPDTYEFDPTTQTISATNSDQTRVSLTQQQLASLALDDQLERLNASASRLNLPIPIDAKLSLAQWLELYDFDVPQTRDAVWDLIEQLAASEPEPIPPACDLANADIALLHLRQQLTGAHDRDTLSTTLGGLIAEETRAPLSAGHPVILHDTALSHPALTLFAPRKQTNLKHGLQRYNLNMPLDEYAAQKTRHQLETNPPVSPRLGNYWAALGLPQSGALTLSAEQRATVIQTSGALRPRPNKGLLDLLGAERLAKQATPAQADGLLNALLASPAAQKLADQLIAAVQWYGHAPDETSNRASRDALVLAALILDLDPQAGLTRYRVAGLDLNHRDYWGWSYQQLRTAIELHLIDTGAATAATTALVAHILLAGIAPEFLVQDIPDSLYFMSSHAWMLFKQGVMLAEALAVGSSRHLTFSDVMTLATQTSDADAQTQWREHYATSSLIDWAVAQGELQPAAQETAYRLDQIEAVKTTLATRIDSLREASTLFTIPLTTRRSLALQDLERVFPGNRWLTFAGLQWGTGPQRLPSFQPMPFANLQSLVDLHMSGRLQPFAEQWRTSWKGFDLAKMKPHFAKLADINRLFKTTSETRIQQLKKAYTYIVRYLLAQLPLADRSNLQEGVVQLLVVRRPSKKPPAEQTPEEKMARTGRFGFILRCEVFHNVHYYELFALRNLVFKNTDLPANLTLGGEPFKVTTGTLRSPLPTSLLYLGTSLAIDEQAYLTGSPPRPDQHSTVVVDKLWQFDPAPALAAPLAFDSPRSRSLASTIVDQHFFLDIDPLLAEAKGSTLLEEREKNAEALYQALLNLIPFWSCGKDLASGDTRRQVEGAWGCFLDTIGLFMPTKGLLIGGLSRLKNVAPTYVKLLQLSKLSARYLNDTLNPLEFVPSLVRLTRFGLIRLNQSGRLALAQALRSARHTLAPDTAFQYLRLPGRADVGPATLTRADALTDVLVINRLDTWHAFDPYSARPYGPALLDFRLKNAIEVTPFSAADGYKALVAEPYFDTPPLLIQRSNATDLVTRERVWRLRHDHLDHLDDLNSPAFVGLTDEFEYSCPSGRPARSPIPLICFTKKIHVHHHSIEKRRVQALEHIRLIPAPLPLTGKRKLVINRCVYDVSPYGTEFRLIALPQLPPLRYKPVASGKVLDEPEFGMPNFQRDSLLDTQSVAVKLNGIVDGIDDKRTLRGLMVDLTAPSVAVGTHLVVEADVGVFYKAMGVPGELEDMQLHLLDFSKGGDHKALINGYAELKNRFLQAGGFIRDQPLVALPTLETLYGQLARRGFSEETVAMIRVKGNTLTKLKQRELLLHASSEGRRLDIHVVSHPIRIEFWAPQPTAHLGVSQLNQYLAERANISTLARVDRTGIGSANITGATRDEALRMQVARPVVMWEYSMIERPSYTEVILRTGAGNCDQLAHVALEHVHANDGAAQLWGTLPPAHAFVVVGTPPPGVPNTLDFSEAHWADLWICDPWTSIVCPAQDYMRQLIATMEVWNTQRLTVLFHDGTRYRWGPANDPAWLELLKTSVKYTRD
ncbi:hypothetical protein [Pseudomonas sp.]|uniref:hypothetical protein n=1 Tax=Pseudomonas sp. TaxID=306 RepID=UPI00262D4617|nr:hypothetical protein [Pseudomonas sp.]